MRKLISGITAALFVTTVAAFGQTTPRPSFEVASIKPAAPIDMQKMAAAMMSGGEMPKMGPHVDGAQAEYSAMALKELIIVAYKVKPFQISGPDWIASTRFDIKAKMPAGSTKDDAPLMLQSLLEDRFKMTIRRETKDRQVLALVVGKGGAKMKESPVAQAIDENSPPKAGETTMQTAEGPMRMKIDPKTGGANIDMGAKGKFTYKMDPANGLIHMDATQITMAGFADMLTQFSTMGSPTAKNIVDMTDLKGSYEVAIEFSMADMLAMARAAGMDVPAGAGGPAGGGAASAAGGAAAASTPGGGTSITDAVAALGLKLESRKAPVEQLIIDKIEKTPVEN
jgi:uncharacterized protein (TIGR03435 family)